MTKPIRRKTILRLGRRGAQVRVLVDRRLQLVRCQWKERGKTRTESWPLTPEGQDEACSYAHGAYERLTQSPVPMFPPITLRELWDAYWLAVADDVRSQTTAVGYLQRWRKFETFAGRTRLATEVTPALLDEYRKALTTLGHVPNQVRLLVAAVRRIIRWGVNADRLPMTKVLEYRVKSPKGKRALPMHEYRRDEAAAILVQFDPRTFHGWRPYVLTVLCAMTGRRARSLLHLEWRDVDLRAGTVHWRAETDKMWQEQTRPLPAAAVDALWVAYGWWTVGGVGAYVFPAIQKRRAGKPWTYSAACAALHSAETRAGVDAIKYRAFHGFRRGVVGDLLDATGGNYKVAADYIGDRDLRIVRQSYDKERAEQLTESARILEAMQTSVEIGTQTKRGTTEGAATDVEPHDGGRN